MNRFNLSFKGTILPGYELERVQTRLANALGLPSPESAAPFFSGKPVTLRRNLDRKIAADWYRKLREIGMDVELVKATEPITPESKGQSSPAVEATKPSVTSAPTKQPPASMEQAAADTNTDTVPAAHRGMNQEIRQSQPGLIDQSWAVPSSGRDPTSVGEKVAKAQVSEEQRRAQADAAAKLAAEQAAEAARRDQLEEDARRKAQQSREQERRQQEERDKQAAKLAAERKAKARRDAQEQEKARKAAEEKAKKAAELKALQQAEAAREAAVKAQRAADEKAERARLAQEEAQRQREEQRKAEELAAAEAARARAAALEEKRKAAARAALQKAQEEERKRLAAQELAHKKAQEKKRKAEEAARAKAARDAEKARRKAEREEAKRKATAAAEQARAEREQARLKAREEAQRAKEEKAEKAKIAAQNAAREKARQEALRVQREAELAEKRAREKEAKLLAAAEAARQKAEAEHRKAEAAAKLQAKQEEARLAQKLAQAEAEQARKAALAAQKQEQAKEKQRKADERARRKAAEQAQREQQQAQILAERAKLEDQVIATGAARLKDSSTGGSTKARVKTRLELPARPSHHDAVTQPGNRSSNVSESAASTSDASTPMPTSRHQPGAPNLYTLEAFHNSQALRQRPVESAAKAKRGMFIVAAALAILVAVTTTLTLREPEILQHGPNAIASSSDGELVVLGAKALYLHDRSGLGTQTLPYAALGLESLHPPLHFEPDGSLLGLGVRSGSSQPAELVRCVLADKQCTQVFDTTEGQTPSGITSFAINALNGDHYVLSHSPATLQRYNAKGELLAHASLPIAELPTMQLDSGLVFISSQFDSAISVFRPDVANFGQQLDEVLLMPPPAIANQHSLVLDFLPFAQQWWVVLGDPESRSSALYRFDASWRYLSELPLPSSYYPARLSRWNQKVLVSHPSQVEQIRLSNEGLEEARYQSDLLVDAASAHKRAVARQNLLRRALPALLLALTLIAAAYSWTHRLRSRVYLHSKAQGAESLEGAADKVRWINPDPRRSARYRQLALLVATGYAGVLVTSVGLTLPLSVLAAILLVMSGPAITLYMLYRAPVGHIGCRDDTLVLVDHNGLYHLGAGPRIQYRSRFVLIDDVVVFMGASLLPTFEPDQLKTLEATITAGVKVESKAVWVRLLQARHPLAIGSLVSAAGILVAGIVLFV